MSEMKTYTHWKIGQDEAGIAWLAIDCPDAKLNILSTHALEELEQIVDQLNIELPKGLVLHSSKDAGFIAGADIKEFTEITSEQAAIDKVSYAHSVFNRLEALPIPKVVLIHGLCLGGGLELALCFDYLIGESEASCKLALPEVRLGIHPGYGGSVRLIERIGVPKAMDIMLSGRMVIAFSAKKMGLLDKAIAKRYFKTAAIDYVNQAPAPQRANKLNKLLNLAPARAAMAKILVKKVSARANPAHYPAPFALIELWKQYGGNREEMLKQEINSIAALSKTPASHNLVRIFFLQEALKSAGKSKGAPKIQKLHVIGAGVMGGDIAAWSALRGIRVSLQDQNPESIARAMSRAKKLFKKKLKIAHLVQAAMDRLTPDLAGAGIEDADLILEAIFENLEVKRKVFADVEARAKPDAILASNTSSIPIEDIAKALKKPGRLVGIHFFNPVAKMQLVEIVKGAKTLKKVLDAANAYTLQIGRMPVGVKSSPGFLVNRVLMPYLIEAVKIHDEGVDAVHIDNAASDFGMPMGPVELADTVGLDICLHVAKNLLGEDNIPASLKEKTEKGDLGKKTGRGYYAWSKGKPKKPDAKGSADLDALASRMLYPLLNECVACLREGVVASADELDAGVIFGTGFAPFKGGPMHMIEQEGASKIVARLKQLETEHGERFKPDAGWATLEAEE
jgi:3-hydroxyacyl-CoA dehydrogenase/enoyl-CoA hydratase/3-hydroxybutyryl-CoA epimerase